MPAYEVTTDDGAVYEVEVPEGASEQDAINYVRSQHTAQPEPIKMKNRFMQAIGMAPKPLERFGRGLADPLVGIAQMYANSPAGTIEDVNTANQIYQANKGDPVEGVDWMRTAGNIVGTAPALLANPLVAGALSAGVMPMKDFSWKDKAVETVIGGILGKVLNPKLQGQEGTRELLDAGVQPTVGQVFNGPVGRLEELAQSVPITGDAVRFTRQNARDQFGQASIKRVYDKLGMVPPKTIALGFEGIDAAGHAVSQSYKDALSQIGDKTVRAVIDPVDHTFNYAPTMQYVNQLSDAAQKEFYNVIDNTFTRTGNLSNLTGNVLQVIDSDLGALSRRYLGSNTASDKGIGLAIREVQNSLRSKLSGVDPDSAALLHKAREGFKEHLVLSKAAERAMLRGGEFTPGQYANAAKSAKASPAVKQWATRSANILGDRQPNSNTTERMLMNAVVGGGAAILHPPTLAAATGAAATALPIVQRSILEHILNNPGSKYQAIQNLFPLTAAPVARGTEW